MVRTSLPIDTALPGLIAALGAHRHAVLQAPPGAGKTTRVPLALRDAALSPGKIVMLEPRRIAARAAAERMAETLGEPVGRTVGYRIRGEAKVSTNTRIEVVTEGILTRILQSDPALSGIGTVIFDEFHERSLNADLGLALALEVRAALRDDLHLVVMSATLDAAPVAALMGGAPVITSEGRSFPVETVWRDKPLPKDRPREAVVADQAVTATKDHTGSVLVFLPGEREIRRTEAALAGRLPPDCQIRPLYGALPAKAQRAAIAPAATGRKIVLASAIAETSLTIEDVRVVIDAGLARRARFDPGSGMSRLVTEKVSRAEADQRRGRAGRVATGTCYRMWTKGEEGGLPAYPPAEIEAADLTSLVLDLAVWGARDPGDLPFPTAPNPGAFAEARALLQALGALDADGAITDHGRDMAALPVHPRLAHMLRIAGRDAAPLAALLSDRDPLRGAPADLSLRLRALRDPRSADPKARPALDRIAAEAKRLSARSGDGQSHSPAQQAALAYPDRIGLRRPGDDPRFVLSGGKGARLDPADPLAGARLIVVTDTDGHPREARIRQAIDIGEAELRAVAGDAIGWQDICHWSKRERRVITRRQERLGALVLDDRIWREAPGDAIARAMLDGVRELGLPLSPAAARLQARVARARAAGHDLPDMSEEVLMDDLESWLLPFLTGIRSAEDWRKMDLMAPLEARLGWDGKQLLDRLVPASFATPLGRKVPIDYATDPPEIALRLQELFGVTEHPRIAGQPLKITLLSPAGRPVQTTADLPGFWATSYADVRKDMRGRYPKHPWPEDPTQADPTLRAKRRPS